MRKRLERFVGQRRIFTATFIDFGKVWKQGVHCKRFVLIEDVCSEAGKVVADHMWMPLRREEYITVPLQFGDTMRFEAEVNVYTKGSRRRRRIDYGLCRPTGVERIEAYIEVEKEA